MTKIVGLTGGICSGKSMIAEYINKLKIQIHDSDKAVMNLYKNPSSRFKSRLSQIGLLENNKISKLYIREQIYSDKVKKRALENYLHKEIAKERNKFINQNKKKASKIIFLDIPLLFENNLQNICSYVCFVYAPIILREKRALKRKGMTKKTFRLIVQNQTTDSVRRRGSDYIINNSSTKKLNTSINNNIIYIL